MFLIAPDLGSRKQVGWSFYAYLGAIDYYTAGLEEFAEGRGHCQKKRLSVRPANQVRTSDVHHIQHLVKMPRYRTFMYAIPIAYVFVY